MSIKRMTKMVTFESSGFIFIALVRQHIENAIKKRNPKTTSLVEMKTQNTEKVKYTYSTAVKTR